MFHAVKYWYFQAQCLQYIWSPTMFVQNILLPLPPGDNPIAVNKYYYYYYIMCYIWFSKQTLFTSTALTDRPCSRLQVAVRLPWGSDAQKCAATRDFLPYIYFGVGPCSGPAPYAVFPLQPSPTVDLRYWLDGLAWTTSLWAMIRSTSQKFSLALDSKFGFCERSLITGKPMVSRRACFRLQLGQVC